VLPTARAFVRARAFARGRAGLVSFAAVDTWGELRCHECWRRYTAASVVKAMLLVAYLDSVSSARRSLTSADRALLSSMIRISDNDAATAVYLRVGDAGLQRLARRAGMKAFAVSGYWGYAQITAADQARFFAGLNGLTPRKFLAYARGLLSSIVSWQSWGIPEVARPHWRTFFKGGWRGSSRGQLVHQGARLERGRLSIAIAVLTDGNPNHAYGRGTVRGIAAHLIRAASPRPPAARSEGARGSGRAFPVTPMESQTRRRQTSRKERADLGAGLLSSGEREALAHGQSAGGRSQARQ
jgi:hypothetical protein